MTFELHEWTTNNVWSSVICAKNVILVVQRKTSHLGHVLRKHLKILNMCRQKLNNSVFEYFTEYLL